MYLTVAIYKRKAYIVIATRENITDRKQRVFELAAQKSDIADTLVSVTSLASKCFMYFIAYMKN